MSDYTPEAFAKMRAGAGGDVPSPSSPPVAPLGNDPRLVPYAPVWPNCCARCTAQKGPLWDTLAERPGFGRVYICLMCLEEGARVAGYLEGPEMERLHNAIIELAGMERLNAEQAIQIDEKDVYSAVLEGTILRLTAERDEALGRVTVLERGIREGQEATQALVP